MSWVFATTRAIGQYYTWYPDYPRKQSSNAKRESYTLPRHKNAVLRTQTSNAHATRPTEQRTYLYSIQTPNAKNAQPSRLV